MLLNNIQLNQFPRVADERGLQKGQDRDGKLGRIRCPCTAGADAGTDTIEFNEGVATAGAEDGLVTASR